MTEDHSLLRFSTAGSVDDGKSTLIGRLLYDSKAILRDQMEAVERSSRDSGEEEVNLALLTDGLRAEREQKITIDVAYRYFATPRRKFIIADTPGHIQYTRNMITGASTADLTIVLVDATRGVLTQSRRHAFIASLLQIPHMIIAVNKMDLVDYDEQVFRSIVDEFTSFAEKLEIDDISFIPVSALRGCNIVDKSAEMPWYQGSTLMYMLENVRVGSRRNKVDFRFPVQYVIRPNQQFRGYAGTISSGAVRCGDEIMILPSRLKTRVRELWDAGSLLQDAAAGQAVVMTTEDEVDISRGDMVVRTQNLPEVASSLEAVVCWMNETPLQEEKQYLIMHTTHTVQATPVRIYYRIDVDTLRRSEAASLGLNEIGRVRFRLSRDLFYDPYKLNNETGSFIVIDPGTNVTVGAGMIRGTQMEEADRPSVSAEENLAGKASPDVVWESWNIPAGIRSARHGHAPRVIWLTGPSGAGKSTIARALEKKLWSQGIQTMLLDGDQLRHGLCSDLGFDEKDRKENIRRAGELAKLLYEHGQVVICAFVSPFVEDRKRVRALFPEKGFIEIQVTCSRETAMRRDPKGLYARAQRGEIAGLTGFDGNYESNPDAELTLHTDDLAVEDGLRMILSQL